MGLLGFLFGDQAKSRQLFNDANKYWRAQSKLQEMGDEQGQTVLCVEIIHKCQSSIMLNPLRGDSYILMCNAILTCAYRSNLDYSAGVILRTVAGFIFVKWQSMISTEGFHTKSLDAAAQVMDMIEAFDDGDFVDSRKHRLDLSTSDAGWFEMIESLCHRVEGVPRQFDVTPLEIEFRTKAGMEPIR